MSLIKRYSNHSLQQLVMILESGDDYTKEAKDAIRTILGFKQPLDTEIKELAAAFWEVRINENIKTILLQNQKPESEFLSDEEMKTILIAAFEKYKEKVELFEIDTKKYWFV